MHHDLKAEPDSFHLLELRISEVQLRKNDRDFKAGDTCRFYKWDPKRKIYTGHTTVVVPIATLLEDHEGLTPGWCLLVLGLPTNGITRFDAGVAGLKQLP